MARTHPAALDVKKGPGAVAAADDRVPRPTGRRRRQQILEAAITLFSAKGYRGTGIAALAERVGVTAPALLYYFGTKERLLTEVVGEADRSRAGLLAAMEETSTPSEMHFRDLRRMGRHNVATADLTRLYAVLTAENLGPDDPLHAFFVERYAGTRSWVRSLLRRDQRQGLVRPGVDLDRVAAEVTALALGAEMQWILDPSAIDLESFFQTYIDDLADRLAPGTD